LRTVWSSDENLSTGKRLYSTLDPVGEAEGTLLEESRLSLDWKTKDFSHFRRLYYCSNLANLDLSAMSIDSYPETPIEQVTVLEYPIFCARVFVRVAQRIRLFEVGHIGGQININLATRKWQRNQRARWLYQ